MGPLRAALPSKDRGYRAEGGQAALGVPLGDLGRQGHRLTWVGEGPGRRGAEPHHPLARAQVRRVHRDRLRDCVAALDRDSESAVAVGDQHADTGVFREIALVFRGEPDRAAEPCPGRVERGWRHSLKGHAQEIACRGVRGVGCHRSEEHTSELQSPWNLVCRLLLEKKTPWRWRCRLPPWNGPTPRELADAAADRYALPRALVRSVMVFFFGCQAAPNSPHFPLRLLLLM